MKLQKHIEIVSSSKSRLSSMSKASRDAVQSILARHYTKVGITIVNNLADLKALVAARPDLVFLGMKFIITDQAEGSRGQNKIWLSQYLDDHGIAYTGSNQKAHELEFSKQLAKRRVAEAGLKTSPFHVVRHKSPDDLAAMTLRFPVFIKPTDRGGGLGIDSASVAHNFEQAQAKVASIATNLRSDSLIEAYLPGREFSVAILKNRHTLEHSVMPLELIAPADKYGARFLSARVKSADTEASMEIADEATRAKICALAIGAFHALGARDYGRVDIRLDAKGSPHFLEANLLPGLINHPGSYFPKACRLTIKMEHVTMILAIVQLAFSRLEHTYDNLLSLQSPYPVPVPLPAFELAADS